MNKSELAKVFKAMTLDKSKDFGEGVASQKCFIGQPVLISPKEAVLRIALGSDSLRDFISSADTSGDSIIVQKMALLGANFDKL